MYTRSGGQMHKTSKCTQDLELLCSECENFRISVKTCKLALSPNNRKDQGLNEWHNFNLYFLSLLSDWHLGSRISCHDQLSVLYLSWTGMWSLLTEQRKKMPLLCKPISHYIKPSDDRSEWHWSSCNSVYSTGKPWIPAFMSIFFDPSTPP